MKNNYGLPKKEIENIFERDKSCVYCGKKMTKNSDNGKNWPTIEHLNFLPPWNNPETVVICCWSCNSSRGNKKIADWFKLPYCLDRSINEKTVTTQVRQYIKDIE